jgi:hypothetical protein
MGALERRGKPPNALRAKGVEKEEEEEDYEISGKSMACSYRRKCTSTFNKGSAKTT